MSSAAEEDINERKQKSRPRALVELGSIARTRRIPLTPQQLQIVASILSYLIPPHHLREAVKDWLLAADADADAIDVYFDSRGWSKVLSRAQAAERGEHRMLAPASTVANNDEERRAARRKVDPRLDFAVPRIRSEFAIGTDEEEALNLTLLVSERRRSELRRRAEGIPQLGARVKVEPWKAEGVSKATYYRRAKQSAEEDAARLLATITAAAEPRPEAGAVHETHFDVAMVAESLTPPEASPGPYRGTAAAARLAALAGRLGLVWTGQNRYDVETWYNVPEGVVLAEQDAADFQAAKLAAGGAERRRDAVERAREREEDEADPRTREEKHAAMLAWNAERAAALSRGDRPARVSEAAWNAVPLEIRTRVLMRAGRFFIERYPPDVAVALAVHRVRREDIIIAALRAADTALDVERAKELAAKYWTWPTHEAVNEALQIIAREDAELRAAEDAVAAVVRSGKIFIPENRRTIFETDSANYLVKNPHVGPEHVVRTIHAIWISSISK